MKWKLVPVEVTPEIREVIRNESCVYQSEDEFYHALLEAAPPAPSVPDGWKLVPYTPTDEMLERAAYAVNNRPQPSKYEPSATPAIIFWTAMLNYAPEAVFINSCSKPPKLSDERIWEIYDELVAEVAKGGSMFNFARAIEREILGGGHE